MIGMKYENKFIKSLEYACMVLYAIKKTYICASII